MKKILIISFLFISVVLNATKYYISPIGSDITGNGVITSPWKSLYKACGIVKSQGDIIHVNPGTYIENLPCYLAVGVSIEGEGATSIITSSSLTGEWDTIIWLQSAIEIDGNQSISYLKFNGNSLITSNALWIRERNNVKVHHCTFVDFHYKAIQWIQDDSYTEEPPAFFMTGCEFYNNTITNCALYDGFARGALTIGGHIGMLIHDNTITQTGRTAGTNGWPIEMVWMKGLKIYNNILFKDDLTNWTFCIEGFHLFETELYGNIITGSVDLNYCSGLYIHNNIIGPEINPSRYYGIDLEFDMSDIVITHNKFRNCSVPIIHAPRSNSVITNYEISYNLFEDIGKGNIDKLNSGIFFSGWLGWSISNLKIHDNIFHINSDQKFCSGIEIQGFGSAKDVNITNNTFINSRSGWFMCKDIGLIDGLNIKGNRIY